MIEQLNYLNPAISKLNNFWIDKLIYPNICLLMLIDKKLSQLALSTNICPKAEQIFSVLYNLSINKIKIVILGQDPYHGENEAIGYAFATNQHKIPPSLRNIYKELGLEYGIDSKLIPNTLLQDKWINQGVTLLNTVLTVSQDTPKSHSNIGWEHITNSIIKLINNHCQNVVFLLWGQDAQQKINLIDNNRHLILTTSHPSPFSANRGFIGCNHFKIANQFLIKNNISPINWY
jgi:uracil-DNA glycosylase